MDWKLIATVGVPGIIIVAGWFFAHWLTTRRELAARRREARLKALEAAYMRIATSSNRPLTDESIEKLETFVSEIQLYGTPKQILLMQKMVEDFKQPGTVSHDAILADLRDTIRQELELEPVQGSVWWLRLNRPAVARTEASSAAALPVPQAPPEVAPNPSIERTASSKLESAAHVER